MSERTGSLGGLRISSAVEGDVGLISLDGELDLASAPALEQRLQELEGRRPAKLILDLTALSFLDSTGLRVLLQADGRARERGCKLVVRRGEDSVQRVFEVTGAHEMLTFEPADGDATSGRAGGAPGGASEAPGGASGAPGGASGAPGGASAHEGPSGA